MQLSKMVNISSGPNSLEIKERFGKANTYNSQDLEQDLYEGCRANVAATEADSEPIVHAGDLLLNTMNHKAGIVSTKSAGKVMPQNLIRLSCDYNKVDAWYLCYVLNESQSIKHQLYLSLEGSKMLRVTTTSLKKLNVELPSITEQREIGETYRRMMIQLRLRSEYSKKFKQAVLATLNKADINGEE